MAAQLALHVWLLLAIKMFLKHNSSFVAYLLMSLTSLFGRTQFCLDVRLSFFSPVIQKVYQTNWDFVICMSMSLNSPFNRQLVELHLPSYGSVQVKIIYSFIYLFS